MASKMHSKGSSTNGDMVSRMTKDGVSKAQEKRERRRKRRPVMEKLVEPEIGSILRGADHRNDWSLVDEDGNTRSKREYFGWRSPEPMGEFRLIDKYEINVDHNYQRFNLKQSNIVKIARDFEWGKFGVLNVTERANGELFCSDGQHRLWACWQRDDVERVPCLVLPENVQGVAKEAEQFRDMNQTKSIVNVRDRYYASIVAKDRKAMGLEAMLDRYGYTMGRTSKKDKPIVLCVRKLIVAWDEDPLQAELVFAVCAELSVGTAIKDELFTGLWLLSKWSYGHVVDKHHVERLHKLGLAKILSTIAEASKARGVTVAKQAPISIYEMLNYQRRQTQRLKANDGRGVLTDNMSDVQE